MLGFLFRSTTNDKKKTNLLLILTPYVIRDQQDLRKVFERKMQERQEFLDRYFVFEGEWEAPRDYSRANGLVEDIRQYYAQLDEQLRLEAESAPLDKGGHEPSPPIELADRREEPAQRGRRRLAGGPRRLRRLARALRFAAGRPATIRRSGSTRSRAASRTTSADPNDGR